MKPPTVNAEGIMNFTINLETLGPVTALGYLEMSKDLVKEYFAKKHMKQMQESVIKPPLGVLRPNGGN